MKKRVERQKRAKKERRVEREKRAKKSVRHARKKFVYKLVLVLWIILLFIALFFLIIFVLEKISEKAPPGKELKGELKTAGPFGGNIKDETGTYFPDSCNEESLKEAWDRLFLESSDGITLAYDCEHYLMYKELAGSNDYLIIYGEKFESLYATGDFILGIRANLTSDVISSLKEIDNSKVSLPSTEDFIDELPQKANERNAENVINSESKADIEFSKIFKAARGSWKEETYKNEVVYIFEGKGSGIIFANLVFDGFVDYLIEGTCMDSDITLDHFDGKNYYKKGYTYDLTSQKTDSCSMLGSLSLYEYFCEKSIAKSMIYDCATEGKVCDDGKCVAPCIDSDGFNSEVRGMTKNLSETKMDYCINENMVMEYECDGADIKNSSYSCASGKVCKSGEGKCTSVPENTPPVFIPENCSSIRFEVNTNYTLNMEDCFYDEEGDILIFNYTEMDISNISITRENNYLTFLPNVSFTGNGSFYIFANDSINETKSDEIKVEVSKERIVIESCTDEDNGRNKTVASTTANSSYSVTDNCDVNGSLIEYYCNGTVVESEKISCGADYSCEDGACAFNSSVMPEIINSTPQGKKVSIFSNESKMFTISAVNYDSIKWYLDDELVDRDVNSYEVSDLEEGNHTLKVEITKGNKVISKTWDLFISKEEAPKKSYLVYFIIIFVILGLLAIFIIFLIIRGVIEKKETKSTGPIIQLAPQQKPESALQDTSNKT